MHYIVYKLLFPGGEVYIGKTGGLVADRWGKNGTNYHEGGSVREAIDKYGWENVNKIILYENITYEEACRLETEEITKHGGINHPLVLNDQSGGDKGFTMSETAKEKLSIKATEIGKRRYKEHPEYFVALTEASKMACSVKVDQYSYDYSTLLATYDSMADAARALGVNEHNISACINGRIKSLGGFRWIRHGKKFGIMQYDNRGNNKFPIDQLDPNTGKVIATYNSQAEAENILGIAKGKISYCIRGYRNTAGGFKWRKSPI